jgi:hypothetical protein
MEREPGSPLAALEAVLHLATVVGYVAKVAPGGHTAAVLEVVVDLLSLALKLVALGEIFVMLELSLHKSKLAAVG